MKTRGLVTPLLVVWAVIAAACNLPRGMTEPASEPVSVGALVRELDVLEHGPNPDEMVRVEDSVTLNPGDALRVTQGGEGVLDFGDFLKLRLFNDTQVSKIIVETAPDIPLNARLSLERGGFTGILTEEGSKGVFATPGGVEITVLGTIFFVVYNPRDGTTAVGNFEGSVGVISGGQIVSLTPGHFFAVPAGRPPGEELPLSITLEEFNAAARELKSPIEVVNRLLMEPTPTGLPPSPGPSPSSTPSSSPPPTEVAVATPTRTRTPSQTPVPPTLTRTQPACPPMVTIYQPTFCREGPSSGYRTITGFEPPTTLTVDGQSPSTPLWWWIEIPTGGHCWVSDDVVTIDGDTSTSCVRVVQPPPTYTPTFTPSFTPTPTITNTPCLLGTPCP